MAGHFFYYWVFFYLFVSLPFDVHFGRGKWYLVRLFLCNPARLESNGEERREVRDFRPSVRLDWPADVVAASLSWSVCPVWFLFSMTNVSFHRLFRLRWQNRCRQRSALVDFLRHSIGSCAGRIGNLLPVEPSSQPCFLSFCTVYRAKAQSSLNATTDNRLCRRSFCLPPLPPRVF